MSCRSNAGARRSRARQMRARARRWLGTQAHAPKFQVLRLQPRDLPPQVFHVVHRLLAFPCLCNQCEEARFCGVPRPGTPGQHALGPNPPVAGRFDRISACKRRGPRSKPRLRPPPLRLPAGASVGGPRDCAESAACATSRSISSRDRPAAERRCTGQAIKQRWRGGVCACTKGSAVATPPFPLDSESMGSGPRALRHPLAGPLPSASRPKAAPLPLTYTRTHMPRRTSLVRKQLT